MKFDKNLLYGIYELEKIEVFKDGQPTEEKGNAGMITFTRDNKMSVVNGSNEWVMAYVGNFDLKEDTLSVQVKCCVVREKEGTAITRKILVMDGEQLVLDATGPDKSRMAKIYWKKTTKL